METRLQVKGGLWGLDELVPKLESPEDGKVEVGEPRSWRGWSRRASKMARLQSESLEDGGVEVGEP